MRIKPEDRKHIDLYYLNENNQNLFNIPPEAAYCSGRGYETRPPKMDHNFKESRFGDEYFLFEENKGIPKYENADDIWKEFIRWIRKRQRILKKDETGAQSYEYGIGKQLIEFAKKRDAHDMYILMKRNWVEFRDTYLCVEGCPESIMEFVRGITYKRMTEKQMWGGDEERMPKGRVIIFDKNLMPKEGEDTGNLIFEYRPNYREEMLQGMDGQKDGQK